MKLWLKDKSAVITGGGNGIGRGIALMMAEQEAKVVVADLSKEAADNVVAEIKKAGGTAVANNDSVATMAGGANIIKTAIDNFGKIDILVTCAGNFKLTKTVEMTEADWDSIIAVHLKGHFSCCQAAAQEMIKQKSGRIITCSSRAAMGGGGNPAYSAAKAGILAFTSALSNELYSEYGIAVNSLIPSADTTLFPGERPKPPAGMRGLPPAQCIEPEYVAPMVTYLATDEAQGITGRYIYAAGSDICIYPKPLEVPGEAAVFARTEGKWTLEKLHGIIPSLLGLD